MFSVIWNEHVLPTTRKHEHNPSSFSFSCLLSFLHFPLVHWACLTTVVVHTLLQLNLLYSSSGDPEVPTKVASMKVPYAAWLTCFLTRPVLGALVGYGIYPYEPPCAHACDRSLSSLMLECSSHVALGMDMHGGSAMTSPQCRAGDTPWLTTLAWCMRTKCAESNVSTSELEAFWEKQSTEDPTVAPKWGYSTTLFNVTQPPTRKLTKADDTLNFTALVNPAVYEAQYNALTAVQRENFVESGYGYDIGHSLVSKMCELLTCGNIALLSSSLVLVAPCYSHGWAMCHTCQAS